MSDKEQLLAANEAIAKDRDDARAELATARAALVAITEADCCGCSVYGEIAKRALSAMPTADPNPARTCRLLTAQEVESIVVDTIECEADDYQSFEWQPVGHAIDKINVLAASRVKEDGT